ncbi:hypothetical protein ACJIZ3_003773 [Penstemon smallii]|uniref:AB hydrolase-1 domain-containing protein n=1 Tax=Penstemon smallii TaxID=265156 RepID=A0ABD3S050_9LAMI
MDESVQLRARGGWITFPFIIGTMAGLMLGAGGWVSNLIVYLIQEFNIKTINAAKIYNFVNGTITIFPILGAIIADSFLGCFSVIWFSSLISLLGILLLVLTAAIKHLPTSCENICNYPTQLQLAVLYLGLALASLGNAGMRFTIAPMGADQFDKPRHQGIFFNWYIFTMYTATVVGSTAIVYIEDNVSWVWGFSLCALANVLGLAVFLSGTRFYRVVRPQGSPFTSLGRVIVAAISKRRLSLSEKSEDYYNCHDFDENATKIGSQNPTPFFRFLNRAALRNDSTSIWKLCTLQQVEDLKTIIKIFPLWTTGLFLCTPLAIQLSLAILQALTMDRHLGPVFKIPAGSIPVFILISTSISIFIIDRLLFPLYGKLTKKPLTLLQRIGIGHALTVISMGISAVVEANRLKFVKYKNVENVVPMSVFWLLFIPFQPPVFTYRRPMAKFSSSLRHLSYSPPHPSLEVIGGGMERFLPALKTLHLPYTPYPLVGWNRHVETIFAAFFRSLPDVRLRRECLRTKDGGAVALDWVSGDDRSLLAPDSPLVILLPGLTGGSGDAYVRHMVLRGRSKGWRVVVFNSRGCGDSPLITPQFYSASFLGDISEVVEHVHNRYPRANIYAVGWSLGANILVRYVGRESHSCPLSGAVSLCNPFNLVIADEDFRKGFNVVYDKALSNALRRIFMRHALLFEDIGGDFNIPLAANAKSIREFDEGLTRVSFGFKSVDDYYSKSSSSDSVKNVRIPLLCIQARLFYSSSSSSFSNNAELFHTISTF